MSLKSPKFHSIVVKGGGRRHNSDIVHTCTHSLTCLTRKKLSLYQYSGTSVFDCFKTHQIWYSMYFDVKIAVLVLIASLVFGTLQKEEGDSHRG